MVLYIRATIYSSFLIRITMSRRPAKQECRFGLRPLSMAVRVWLPDKSLRRNAISCHRDFRILSIDVGMIFIENRPKYGI